MVKKIIALAIVVGIVGGVLAGCGSKDDTGAAAPAASTAGTAGTAPAATAGAPAATAGATAGTTTG